MLPDILRSAEIMSIFCRLKMKIKAELPIRSSEMGVLIYIQKQPEPVTPLMISQYFRISKPSVTAMINALLIHGYISKSETLHDKRSYYLMITDSGNALVETTINEHYNAIEMVKNEMGTERFNQFIDLMASANQILESIEQ
ncbi:MAG TPA: MarR family transcriptional regulator [Erysipelotrichaceae bacterium]|nr:MarR family transcriptional regulator [Erysipelotrichaceae bacterium]